MGSLTTDDASGGRGIWSPQDLRHQHADVVWRRDKGIQAVPGGNHEAVQVFSDGVILTGIAHLPSTYDDLTAGLFAPSPLSFRRGSNLIHAPLLPVPPGMGEEVVTHAVSFVYCPKYQYHRSKVSPEEEPDLLTQFTITPHRVLYY